MKKVLVFLIILCVILSGCAVNGPAPTPTPAPTPEPTPTPVPTPTPTPEPTPEPIPYLDTETGDIRGWFTSEVTGGYMDYYMYVPEKAVENMPLIVFLHGDGYVGLPDDLMYCGIVERAKEIYGSDMPFILLTPATSVPSWTDWNIPGTLKDLIDCIAADYSCDSEHIIITGHSRGAIGVWTMVSYYPGYFSAAVPVSCPSVGFSPENFLETPVWAFVGDSYNDYGVYGQDMQNHVDCLKLVGAEAQLTVLPDCTHGRTSIEAYTREVFDWMIAQ